MASQKFKIEDVVLALQESKGLVYVAARRLGCSANTIYNYAKKHPVIQETIDQERGLMVDTAELALWRAIQDGEGWAIALVLKTLGKQRGYVERQELTGADGGALTVQAVDYRKLITAVAPDEDA